ncbi:alcohol dehydrogenase catalytic domain-containing protein [Sphingobacterium multivorum]|uniref:alcohol dehydrogenase catalytic domain-containing protein n=1 Tax=Sphingobacterium multivorum TaxID=28454 RepID=UPI0028AF7E34|nr:alcohol dehydrogenase catalytic domain-containing protein [Sphingobacterium multivorum]
MNAVILDQDNQLINAEVTLPQMKPNEVKIKIIASAINPIDYQMRENEFERRYLYSPILGREGAGIITDKGSEVSEYTIGDAVFFACGSMGSNGTYSASFSYQPASLPLNQKIFLLSKQQHFLPLVSPHYRFSTEQQLIRKTIFS